MWLRIENDGLVLFFMGLTIEKKKNIKNIIYSI